MSCSILPILSDQGKCKICKYSQSPFNQFSFSILSLFLRLKTGLNYTRKDVDQKRILNPYFEQLFCRILRACQLSLYRYLWQQCSDSQVYCSSPLQRIKKDRLMLGNRYTLIRKFKIIWVSLIGNSNLSHFLVWRLESISMSDWFEFPLVENSNQSRFCGVETWIKDFFVHNKSLNTRWSTI